METVHLENKHIMIHEENNKFQATNTNFIKNISYNEK